MAEHDFIKDIALRLRQNNKSIGRAMQEEGRGQPYSPPPPEEPPEEQSGLGGWLSRRYPEAWSNMQTAPYQPPTKLTPPEENPSWWEAFRSNLGRAFGGQPVQYTGAGARMQQSAQQLAEKFPWLNKPAEVMQTPGAEFALPQMGMLAKGVGKVVKKVPKKPLAIAAKEPWQMTNKEWLAKAEELRSAKPVISLPEHEIYMKVAQKDALGRSIAHRQTIEKALSEGKPVPSEVLKDYPELATTGLYKTPPGRHEVPQFGEVGAVPQYTPEAAGRRKIIEARLKRGEPVPDKLLAEFPDLAKAIPKAPVTPEVTKPIPESLEDEIRRVYTPEKADIARNALNRIITGAYNQTLVRGGRVAEEVRALKAAGLDISGFNLPITGKLATKEQFNQLVGKANEFYRALNKVESELRPGAEPAKVIPRAEPGMPEAGLQPSMIGEVAAKEVRPAGKGRITQISMDDQLKLAKGYAQEQIQAAVKDAGGDTYALRSFVETMRDNAAKEAGARSLPYHGGLKGNLYPEFNGKQLNMIEQEYDNFLKGIEPGLQPKVEPPTGGAIPPPEPPKPPVATGTIGATPEPLRFPSGRVPGGIEPPKPPVPPMATAAEEPSKFAGNIRLEKFPESVRGLIKDWTDKNPDVITTVRRGVRSDAQVQADAQALALHWGYDPAQIRRTWQPGKALNAEEITAVRQVANDKLAEVKRLQQGISSGADTTENLLKLESALYQMADTLEVVSGGAAEAGRALRAHRFNVMSAVQSGDASKIAAVLKSLGGRVKVEEVAAKLAQINLDDPIEVANFINSITKPKAMDYITELYYNSILSGPKTHIINSLSNTLNAALSPVERVVTVPIENLLARFQGRMPERFMGEAFADIAGALKGYPEGVRAALITLRRGGQFTELGKYELRQQAFRGKLGAVVNWPSRMLEAADALYKNVNYRAAFNATAFRMGKQSGLKGQALLDHIAEVMKNPPEELLKEAGRLAEYRLFRQEAGDITKKLINLRDTNIKGVPVLRFVIPFLRTPVNLVKFGLERSPVGILDPKLWQNIIKKSPEAADQLGRVAIGSAIAGVIALYLGEGTITTAAPTNRAQRDAFYASGKLPYSIKIGDRWVSFQRLEPFNTPITLTASAMLALKQKGKTANEKVGKAAMDIAQNLTSQTYLDSIGSMIDALSDPERYGSQFLERWVTSMAVPYSALSRTVAQTLDPTVRRAGNLWEAIESNIPGLSRRVPAQMRTSSVGGGPTVRTTIPWSPIAIAKAGAPVEENPVIAPEIPETPRKSSLRNPFKESELAGAGARGSGIRNPFR